MQVAQDGLLSMERIDESVQHILALKTRYDVGAGSGSGMDSIQSPEHFRIIAAIYEAVADRREQENAS